MDIGQFKADASLIESGVWIKGPEGSEFLIRSADSKAYRRALAKLARNEQSAKLRKKPELQLQLTIQAMAQEILIDWRGIEDQGKPLPCTLENKVLLLGVTELRSLISEEAQDIANFRKEGQAADAADIKSSD